MAQRLDESMVRRVKEFAWRAGRSLAGQVRLVLERECRQR